ncbi:MAG: ABC transporter ATP-binding protein [Tannerellaceae bacterium]|jgi:ABC-type nitrate/sulfonate/bicarbonate transport system ATPase subunit|nr:ABC transporter ATP-binding protein [Tannerellaceae bacterium]
MTTDKDNTLISLRHVGRTYADTTGRETMALQDVNLTICKGEFISFVGPSGCGKTTLLRLIAGLDVPQSGTLLLEGSPIDGPSHERGYVFQQAALFPWKTVEENIALGLKARHIYREKQHLIAEYLHIIGLEGFKGAYPHEISGGMAQRVAIARALINEPKVLLMDEPLGALDAFTRLELQEALRRVWEKTGTTIVLVTHDVDEAIYLSNRIAIFTARPGRISVVFDVDLPSPPDRDHPDFIAFRRRILQSLH